jgi:hypothetical protein
MGILMGILILTLRGKGGGVVRVKGVVVVGVRVGVGRATVGIEGLG